MRLRDMERRQQVEERKRYLFEIEREKREAILKKNQVPIFNRVTENICNMYLVYI